MNKHWLYILSLLFLNETIKAQTKDSLTLKEIPVIEINSHRLQRFSNGFYTFKLDSQTIDDYYQSNLAELLQAESPIFIKSYGIGGVATTSFRGGSAAHTAILWNGLQINSPLNGLSDLSLIAVNSFENIEIQYGGSTSLWGTGAVGGSIHLESGSSNLNQHLKLGKSIGSYGRNNTHISTSLKKNKWHFNLNVSHIKQENNFPYPNPWKTDSIDILQHAAISQKSILSDIVYESGQNQNIRLSYWHLSNNREIPGNLLQSASTAYQFDESHKSQLLWKKWGDSWSAQSRLAFISDNIAYNDSSADISANNHFQQYTFEQSFKRTLTSNQIVQIGALGRVNIANVSAYEEEKSQNEWTLFAAHKLQHKAFTNTLSLRQSIIDSKSAPLAISNGSQYKLSDNLNWRFSANTIYRLPSLNDRYWAPGGKPNLKPEKGYGIESGLDYNFKRNHFGLNLSTSYFNRRIYDWILWLPDGKYWSPTNIMEVWSRGWNNHASIKYECGDLSVKCGVQTAYTLSTNEQGKSENDLSVGQQLIYTPLYSGTAYLSLEYNKLMINFNSEYMGYRFTATDASEYLSPYNLCHLGLSYPINLSHSVISWHFKVNNLFNIDYQTLENYPMPPINFFFGIQVQFKSLFNKLNN